MEDLRVEIPKRFKESLERRFNLKRIEHEMFGDEKLYFIRGKCELCSNYFWEQKRCVSCPFGKFGIKGGLLGCVRWIEKIVGRFCFTLSETDVNWWEEDDREARQQIKKLVEEAKKLITWV